MHTKDKIWFPMSVTYNQNCAITYLWNNVGQSQRNKWHSWPFASFPDSVSPYFLIICTTSLEYWNFVTPGCIQCFDLDIDKHPFPLPRKPVSHFFTYENTYVILSDSVPSLCELHPTCECRDFCLFSISYAALKLWSYPANILCCDFSVALACTNWGRDNILFILCHLCLA